MAETFIVDRDLSTEEKYKTLLQQLRSLLTHKENLISNLSNLTAAIKHTFDKVSWVGFYLNNGKELYLGPFQGKVACTIIQIGKGVCGTAAQKRETLIVPDVNKFPGHIFCDEDSKSEIVVPIIKNGELFGVLDLDSTSYSSFEETDKKYLEDVCNFLSIEIL